MRRRILFVDDDANVLEAYQRRLRREFDIEIAVGGPEGLAVLTQQGPFAVVVSDMRMPEMDGAAFLSKVCELAPDTVRILLTGQADMQDVIKVVNKGQIFRFLTKPCDPEEFALALKDGIRQHELVTSERELFDQTLKGSIKLLIDILALVCPEAFSRSSQLRSLAHNLAKRLQVTHIREVDFAALLSQIGCVTLPIEILEKKYLGIELDQHENEIFLKHPKIGHDLLVNIPRLQLIAKAIAYQEKEYQGGGVPIDSTRGDSIPIIARILKVVHAYTELQAAGKSRAEAQVELKKHSIRYDPKVLAALAAEILDAKEGHIIREIMAEELSVGMILADDLKSLTGSILVPKQHEVSRVTKIRIANFVEKGTVVEPIKILDSVQS